jgi:hypothetical protein
MLHTIGHIGGFPYRDPFAAMMRDGFELSQWACRHINPVKNTMLTGLMQSLCQFKNLNYQ